MFHYCFHITSPFATTAYTEMSLWILNYDLYKELLLITTSVKTSIRYHFTPYFYRKANIISMKITLKHTNI